MSQTLQQTIFWHGDLPPLDAEVVAEHTVEANSGRVRKRLHNGVSLWDRCYAELMANANARLAQELTRLGGHYAHVYDESVTPQHDDRTGEGWLHGVFNYTLYRRTEGAEKAAS